MRRSLLWSIAISAGFLISNIDAAETNNQSKNQLVLGKPGLEASYEVQSRDQLPDSNIESVTLQLGVTVENDGKSCQWLSLKGKKASGGTFQVWILTSSYPSKDIAEAQSATARYILQEGTERPIEFRHSATGEAVLPFSGAWEYLFPHAISQTDSGIFPKSVEYLGFTYSLKQIQEGKPAALPSDPLQIELRADALIGVPHNTKQLDQTRRYDESDYELIPLTKDDYEAMITAGMNCLRLNQEDTKRLMNRNVYFWGIGGADILYPEWLYRSNYIGPALFHDEPAVCTRDHVVRPRFKEKPDTRKSVTPQSVLKDFQEYYHHVNAEKAPVALQKGLDARPDVNPGTMQIRQQNLYSWETMVATAAHQLSEQVDGPPAAIVFEPPGRIGTRRTLPEMNMAYGCQIAIDEPTNFIDIIYGFLRGAARLTGKKWGMSVYGSVDRADAPWFMTHAYDVGGQYFFFWDSYKLACVPFNECLKLTTNLRQHIENCPIRDLEQLKKSAEIAILLPPGYTLGHVHMGRGNLWGLGELNLERKNAEGRTYREVMGNFFTEIERALRLGISFDLLWDLKDMDLQGYREVIRVLENGKVEIKSEDGKVTVLDGARIPQRPGGEPPELAVEITPAKIKAGATVVARAELTDTTAPTFYTVATDEDGIYRDVKILWELYGPEEEDYRFLLDGFYHPKVQINGDKSIVEADFEITEPGRYRLRAAACDLAGRTTVVWKEFEVEK